MRETERQIVSIKKITGKKPIKKADAIEVVCIGGWECVVKKSDNFQIGDEVIYIEVDAFLPKGNPHWEFLMSNGVRKMLGKEGHRLRTVTLRGQVSQGLVLPLSILEGNSLESLGIVQFEAETPVHLKGLQKGLVPAFLSKPDQERIQNLPLEEFYGEYFEVTEKLEGTALSVYYRGEDSFGVCSKNTEFKLVEENNHNTYVQAANKFNLLKKLEDYYKRTGNQINIHGEIIGEGIQNNVYNLDHKTVYIFDVFNPENYTYIPSKERIKIIEELGLNHVPVIHESFLITEDMDYEFLIDMAKIKSKINPNRDAEGLVFKCISNPKKTFKVHNLNYSLKQKD